MTVNPKNLWLIKSREIYHAKSKLINKKTNIKCREVEVKLEQPTASAVAQPVLQVGALPVIFPQRRCACHTWDWSPCHVPAPGPPGGRTPPLSDPSTGGTAGAASWGCSDLHSAPCSAGPKAGEACFTAHLHQVTVTVTNTVVSGLLQTAQPWEASAAHTCINSSSELCHFCTQVSWETLCSWIIKFHRWSLDVILLFVYMQMKRSVRFYLFKYKGLGTFVLSVFCLYIMTSNCMFVCFLYFSFQFWFVLISKWEEEMDLGVEWVGRQEGSGWRWGGKAMIRKILYKTHISQ